MKITLQQLQNANACPAQRLKFEQFFGQWIEVTPALCEALAEEFDWNWAGHALLRTVELSEFLLREGKAYSKWLSDTREQGRQLAAREIDLAIYSEERRIAGMRYHQALAKTFANLYNRPKAHDFDASETFQAQYPEA